MPKQERVYKWVGEGEIRDGAYHYRSVSIEDVVVSIGDSVYVQSHIEDQNYICQIMELYENLFTGDKEVKVQWYYWPEEAAVYIKQKVDVPHSTNEVIFSNTTERLSITCLFLPIVVENVGIDEFEDDSDETERCDLKSLKCRWFLDTKSYRFSPVLNILQDENPSPTLRTPMNTQDYIPLRQSTRKRHRSNHHMHGNDQSPPRKSPRLNSFKTPQPMKKMCVSSFSVPTKCLPRRSCKSTSKHQLSVSRKTTPPFNQTLKLNLKALSKTNTLSHAENSRLTEMTPEVRSLENLKSANHVRKNLKLHNVLEEVVDIENDYSSSEDEDEEPFPRKRKGTLYSCKISSDDMMIPRTKVPKDDTSQSSRRVNRKPISTKSEVVSSIPARRSKQQKMKKEEKMFESVKERLHVSATPDSITCRENEFINIFSFVEGKLLQNTGGCMYISGVPGTGKTATVLEVSRHLQNAASTGEIPDFKFIEINGMRLTEPRQAYVAILKQLTGEKTTADKAAAILEEYFCGSVRGKKKRQNIVLLADELDLLWTRKQSILYNLFDWPTHAYAKLIVLAVANTMDLPERIMINRVASRLGLTRLTFQPYTFQQLQEIVTSRMTGLKIFETDAIILASRKVAAVSGDARRALDICRRAVEIAQREITKSSPQQRRSPGTSYVGMLHVNTAVNEMFSSPMVMAIRNCSFNQKLFLQAVLVELKRTGLEETTLRDVYNQVGDICRIQGYPQITPSESSSLCVQLAAIRLLLAEPGRGDIHRRIRLNISQDDIYFGLKDVQS